MVHSLFHQIRQHPAAPLTTMAGRQRAVTLALTLADGTSSVPDKYERSLLHSFVLGVLTLDQAMAYLQARQHTV